MGGKNLQGAAAKKDDDASDDDIKVISDNGNSNGKAAFGQFPGRLGGAGMSITPVGGQGWVVVVVQGLLLRFL